MLCLQLYFMQYNILMVAFPLFSITGEFMNQHLKRMFFKVDIYEYNRRRLCCRSLLVYRISMKTKLLFDCDEMRDNNDVVNMDENSNTLMGNQWLLNKFIKRKNSMKWKKVESNKMFTKIKFDINPRPKSRNSSNLQVNLRIYTGNHFMSDIIMCQFANKDGCLST